MGLSGGINCPALTLPCYISNGKTHIIISRIVPTDTTPRHYSSRLPAFFAFQSYLFSYLPSRVAATLAVENLNGRGEARTSYSNHSKCRRGVGCGLLALLRRSGGVVPSRAGDIDLETIEGISCLKGVQRRDGGQDPRTKPWASAA